VTMLSKSHEALQRENERLKARPSAWVCAKCGYGSTEHGLVGHPSGNCAYEPVLRYVDDTQATKGAQEETSNDK
jgi:hypothetical protein